MPTITFPDYAQTLTELVNALVANGQAQLIHLQIDQRSIWLGFIVGTLQFEDESELHFREFVDLNLPEP